MARRRKKKSKKMEPLHVMQPNAAGIDIGGAHSHYSDYAAHRERWEFVMFFKMFHLPAL